MNVIHAYTPGLRVTERTAVRKLRRLPLPGTVHVKVGDVVKATDVVASTELPGRVHTLNIAHELNCQPDEIHNFMLKAEGDVIEHGEILAETKALFGLFHSFVKAPIGGTIETISHTTGQVLFRGEPVPVELDAYVDGTVVEVHHGEGVTVATECALVQGIFGVGGERYGELQVPVQSPQQPLTAELVDDSCKGCVVVGGSVVTIQGIRAAIEHGATAVAAGGIASEDLDEFTGMALGVAITGQEDIPVTLIVTEGFGELAMAERTFRILKGLAGRRASVSGATQIRAGVIRPEIIVSGTAPPRPGPTEEPVSLMSIGSQVRLIREPYFGQLAQVVALPPEPEQIPTEAKVRVLQARLAEGTVVTVPRANVELIQG
jgi:biotin carboxyl carrier protein